MFNMCQMLTAQCGRQPGVRFLTCLFKQLQVNGGYGQGGKIQFAYFTWIFDYLFQKFHELMFPSHEFAMFSYVVKMISIELLTKCSKIRNVTCEDKEEILNISNQQTYHFRHKHVAKFNVLSQADPDIVSVCYLFRDWSWLMRASSGIGWSGCWM